MHICTLDLLHSIALFSLFSGGVRGGKALKKTTTEYKHSL